MLLFKRNFPITGTQAPARALTTSIHFTPSDAREGFECSFLPRSLHTRPLNPDTDVALFHLARSLYRWPMANRAKSGAAKEGRKEGGKEGGWEGGLSVCQVPFYVMPHIRHSPFLHVLS